MINAPHTDLSPSALMFRQHATIGRRLAIEDGKEHATTTPAGTHNLYIGPAHKHAGYNGGRDWLKPIGPNKH